MTRPRLRRPHVTRDQLSRNFRRLLATAGLAAGVYLAFQIVAPLLEPAPVAAPPAAEEAQAAAVVELPERPSSVPARVPLWAWGVYAWHKDTLGTERPFDAPERLPAWYWEWRVWRQAVEAAGASG